MERKIEPIAVSNKLTFTTQTHIKKKQQKYTEWQKDTELLFQNLLDDALSDKEEKEGTK